MSVCLYVCTRTELRMHGDKNVCLYACKPVGSSPKKVPGANMVKKNVFQSNLS